MPHFAHDPGFRRPSPSRSRSSSSSASAASVELVLPPPPSILLPRQEAALPAEAFASLASIAGAATHVQEVLYQQRGRSRAGGRDVFGAGGTYGFVGLVPVAAAIVSYVGEELHERGGRSTDRLPPDLHRPIFEVDWAIDSIP
ncbi:hypothetical protein JCM10207_007768 [Rhodosporidiobolus poonsookiae]